jgi:hypothetical protein
MFSETIEKDNLFDFYFKFFRGVGECTTEECSAYLYAKTCIDEADWHWLQFHFDALPPHPVARELAKIFAGIEAKIPGGGKALISNIASRKNRERNESDYQGILQDFAEILVISRVVHLDWPRSAKFSYEPSGKTGKRPELVVDALGKRYMFEVKAPSLLDHQRNRQKKRFQLPTRGVFSPDHVKELVKLETATLARDGPVKDFLVSGQAKFSDFEDCDGANILVIVWDDYIYEPIGSLTSPISGLLTENSWFRDGNDNAVVFPKIDAVIIIRHLLYFSEGLADGNLADRTSAFDFGDKGSLPNVAISTPWGRRIPKHITNGLRAVDHKDKSIQGMAEYRIQDLIFWDVV